jgi:hypothetical protein
MKKSILFYLFMACSCSYIYAQTKPKPNKLVATTEKTKQKTPYSGQGSLLDKIIAATNLSEVELKIVKKVCSERTESIEKIKLNSDSQQQKLQDLQTVNEDFEHQLKLHLSPSNFLKYESLKH